MYVLLDEGAERRNCCWRAVPSSVREHPATYFRLGVGVAGGLVPVIASSASPTLDELFFFLASLCCAVLYTCVFGLSSPPCAAIFVPVLRCNPLPLEPPSVCTSQLLSGCS
eukprot:RCo043283